LPYDPDAHAAAKARETELRSFEQQLQELTRAEEQIAETENRLAALSERQAYWDQSLSDHRARQGELEVAVAELPQVNASLNEQSNRIDRIGTTLRQAQLRLGAAQQRMDTCARLRDERKEIAQARKEAAEFTSIFEELRASFGRRGVQAIIIETALPEIETEANRLLSRMSDGRMSLRLSSQRETKSGSTVETLDIFVSDELGPRNYELFSGGEAFRIDFALRIAISKMLARRAGAQLRTLFIDEGFGSQDSHGRERLVEAINAIKGDFDRILVITHIEELKDMFPTRIDVVKGPDGSQVTMA
jgi:exonuclease SbcC